MSETGVEKKRLTRHGSRGFTLIDLLVIVAILGILAAIAIPNLMMASRNCGSCNAASYAKTAVTQAIKYAKDKGVYPTSLAVLREEGYVGPWISDKDLWGNEWVLSPVLTRGGIPREGDNVYVFSRGSEGTGVYPQPFTSDTGEEGSIGYSSAHGLWGPSYIHESPVAACQRIIDPPLNLLCSDTVVGAVVVICLIILGTLAVLRFVPARQRAKEVSR